MDVKSPCCHVEDSAKPAPVKAKTRPDVLFWGTFVPVAACYAIATVFNQSHSGFSHFVTDIRDIVDTMFWGIVMGIVAMGLLTRIPRDFVMAALGTGRGLRGILRAVVAGVLLDLCSHGILMVGAKLYERGASAGQVMAFLLSSPWNSLSLTFVLAAMIGWGWTLGFIALSMVIGTVTGVIFDKLVEKGALPANPSAGMIKSKFKFWPATKEGLSRVKWTPGFFIETLKTGIVESKMVLRWIFIGILMAAALRTLVDIEVFRAYFGPSLLGLVMTLAAATVIEVCSEGSAPVAADIMTRAGATGNGFTFLMAGVATDYTEMMVLREVTRSWKITLLLPLVSVPQILVVGYILNGF